MVGLVVAAAALAAATTIVGNLFAFGFAQLGYSVGNNRAGNLLYGAGEGIAACVCLALALRCMRLPRTTKVLSFVAAFNPLMLWSN